jgi:lipoprotein-anchoring transpeptidase ErfK/SrfK
MELTMRRLPLAGTLAAAFFLSAAAAQAGVRIEIDKSTQRMSVTVDGAPRYSWSVSTGTPAHSTPRGSFRVLVLKEEHYSKKYNNAPMPHSIFFTDNGHAIHATDAVKRLGRPASHGCVRLAPQHAALLFALVKRYGATNTSIRIAGADPAPRQA